MPILPGLLFVHTRQPRPDSRPLYAYKTTDAHYEKLRTHLRVLLIALLSGQDQDAELAPIFCLYAAETFRREHAGGPWTWETVFQPLGLTTPNHPQIAGWVEQGLHWWGRPLLHGAGGQRLFLVTIACEGGLPLRLLHQEQTHLNHYFRTILDGYYRGGCGGDELAISIARQQAPYLPRSLRQDPVFHLAGRLIAQIAVLQRSVPTGVEPLAALDRSVPDWRRDLPLRLNDRVAEVLLNGLVERSAELAEEAGARLRWIGRLRQTGTGWRVERYLVFPESLMASRIAALTALSLAERPRLHLLMHTKDGTEAVAWLTVTQGAGQERRFRREWLRRGGLVLTRCAAAQETRLSLSDGQNVWPLEVANAQPFGPVPWVFVERGTVGEPEWLTEGSAQARGDRLWVLADQALRPNAVNGTCDEIARVTEVERVLYRMTGKVELVSDDLTRYRFVCGAADDSKGSFEIIGETMPQVLGQRPFYRGLPRFKVTDVDGDQAAATGICQWRLVGDQGPWRSSHEPAFGQVWLRLIDADGAERCRRYIDAVPASLRIETDIGTGQQAGVVHLFGLAGLLVTAAPELASTVSVTQTGDTARIVCPVIPLDRQPSLGLDLNLPGQRPLRLILPYPRRGAFFQLVGRSLPGDDCVPLDRLAGLRLFVQDVAGGRGYWLRGSLLHSGLQPFQERLPSLTQGRLELSLYPWQERIGSLLASSSDPECQVHIGIETSTGQCMARIRVARYDAVIEPDRDVGAVRLPTASQDRLGVGWETRIRVEMLPLWAPAAPPIELAAQPAQRGNWQVPAGLDDGPWWVIARDGDWTRFRPLLWTVGEEPDTDTPLASPLTAAIREADPERRERALQAAIDHLGDDPQHADWSMLLAFIRLSRDFPAASLDVLRWLAARPRTLAQLLLRADEQSFETAWSLSSQLPFLWILLPVADWRWATRRYFGGLKTSLAELDGGEGIVFGLFQRFREWTGARRPYWSPLGDWLQEQVFPERPLHNSALVLARQYPSILEKRIEAEEQLLMGRHDAEERWTDGSEVLTLMAQADPWMKSYRYPHLAAFYRPVRCAPFVAAYLSLHGISASKSLIYQLRLLRAFDREWFDTVHAIALTIGLTQLPSTEDAEP
jgi:hypothetical protein